MLHGIVDQIVEQLDQQIVIGLQLNGRSKLDVQLSFTYEKLHLPNHIVEKIHEVQAANV